MEETKELKLRQETPDSPEALRCVPSLALSDIPKEPVRVPIEVRGRGGQLVGYQADIALGRIAERDANRSW